MRTGLFSVMFAAIVGAAPALAQQDYPFETSTQADAAPAKPAAAKSKTAKPAAAKTAAKPVAKKDTTGSIPGADPLAEVPAQERSAIRSALLWSAGEDAVNGDQIADAIAAFRKRNSSKATGALTAAEREMLLAAAKTREDEFGWTVVTDPATGIRIGLPAKMVPHARLADQGTRWSSRHGDVQVETFRFKTDETLSAIFERMKKEPATRRPEYSAMRGDNFIISGLQGLRKFTVRAFLRDGEMRGFTMQFDQAMEGIVAPVMVAMASAFAPFPSRIAPFATLTRTVEYGTGMVVSASGHIITGQKLIEGCRIVTVPGIGNAEPVASDKQHGLALLRVYGKRGLPAVRLASATAENSEMTLIGVPDPHIQNGGSKRAEMKARLNGGSAIDLRDSVPVAGFTGAAALDGNGRVIGMMETRNTVLASAEPSAPPVRLVGAESIRGFLAANHVSVPQGAGDARQAIVRIICVKN